MDVIQWLQGWLIHDSGKLIYWLTLWSTAMVVDTILGAILGKLDPSKQFSSNKLKTGIVIKIGHFILALLAIPFAVGFEFGVPLLYVLFTGLVVAELYSIMGHLRVSDDKGNQAELFEQFFKKIMGGK